MGFGSEHVRMFGSVKLRRAQHEHMTPGFPLKADITGHSWRVSNVPEEEVRMR
jgi:hypothetical protein